MSAWPQPRWVWDRTVAVARQQLYCAADVCLWCGDVQAVLVEALVETDELGKKVPGTWALRFRPPDGAGSVCDGWFETELRWPGLAAAWQRFADRTWLAARRQFVDERLRLLAEWLREAGDLPGLRVAAWLEQRRQLEVLRVAYQQPEEQVGAAARLAVGWAGTAVEFEATLRAVLQLPAPPRPG